MNLNKIQPAKHKQTKHKQTQHKQTKLQVIKRIIRYRAQMLKMPNLKIVLGVVQKLLRTTKLTKTKKMNTLIT